MQFPEQFRHSIAQNPLQTVMGNALIAIADQPGHESAFTLCHTPINTSISIHEVANGWFVLIIVLHTIFRLHF